MPRADRPLPVYVQVADHYRTAILDGDLVPGQKLPPISQIATDWGISVATAARAISQLQVEGAIWTSPQGSFVADKEIITKSARDRITGGGPRRSTTNGERIIVNAAETVTAPNYVAELLGIPIGTVVNRREEVTYKRARPQMLSVDWVPPIGSSPLAAELTSPEPLADGTVRVVESVTGRRVTHGRDHLRGRAADAREAGALRIPIGTPILATTNVWSDDAGVLIYGEHVLPPDQVVSYDYAVDPEPVG